MAADSMLQETQLSILEKQRTEQLQAKTKARKWYTQQRYEGLTLEVAQELEEKAATKKALDEASR